MSVPHPAQPQTPHGDLRTRIAACKICAERFAATVTAHKPRPVVWFAPATRLLIAGQAPGLRVHEAGKPFFDRSGDRLREWLGLSAAEFYDRDRVSVVPMAFCFPGYDGQGADLPPPAICGETWHDAVMESLPNIALRVLIGGHAHRWHLGRDAARSVTATVAAWRDFGPTVMPLPHPSWRNTAWLKRNPWFAAELLPVLRQRVRVVLDGGTPR